MTADEAMAYYATRAKIAGLNGDEAAREHWIERINRVSDQREAERRRAEFDLLKGSPDHSAVRHG
jgi:hypothetical protein